jgi:hypothetical protein
MHTSQLEHDRCTDTSNHDCSMATGRRRILTVSGQRDVDSRFIC